MPCRIPLSSDVPVVTLRFACLQVVHVVPWPGMLFLRASTSAFAQLSGPFVPMTEEEKRAHYQQRDDNADND